MDREDQEEAVFGVTVQEARVILRQLLRHKARTGVEEQPELQVTVQAVAVAPGYVAQMVLTLQVEAAVVVFHLA